jgi:uncharacterized protein (TIGR02145 family)
MMNRFFTLLLAASCLTAVGQVPDYVPTEGLVAWYPLDSSVEDESVNGYNLCANSISYTSGRHEDEGGAFLGVYGGDLLTACSSNGSWTTEISYALWFKPLDLESDPYPSGWFALITMDGWNNDSFGTLISDFGEECEAGKHRVRPSWPNNQSFAECGEIELGQWHHLCVTGNEDSSSVFLDGELLFSSQHSPGTDFTEVPFEWTIGASSRHHTYQFKGAIDEVGIWNAELSPDEVLHLFSTSAPIEGCADSAACNFDATATLDDGSCHFNCQFCHDGTVWDEDLFKCVVANPSDSNFDGCVQLNDLLDLLSAYGDCGAEESAWQCGDPLEYQGYDYETVQIGEQCWFAENLRAENYKNGDTIPFGLSDTDWLNTTSGAVAVYGEGISSCFTYSPDGDACNETWSLGEYGRLYNWFAVDDGRELCPTDWHVPTDGDWMMMEMALGMSEVDASGSGWRGTNQGTQLKTDFGWYDDGNGTNSSGFSGLSSGDRGVSNGFFGNAGWGGYWWSSSPHGSDAWYRGLSSYMSGVNRLHDPLRFGFAVRCIKDSE